MVYLPILLFDATKTSESITIFIPKKKWTFAKTMPQWPHSPA
jgi:hypothetical protein